MAHHIKIFTGSCSLCDEAIKTVTVGKCAKCTMEIVHIDDSDEKAKKELARYDIRAVPTIIIDDKIKIVGLPDFPWFCGEEFYSMLLSKYSIKKVRRFKVSP